MYNAINYPVFNMKKSEQSDEEKEKIERSDIIVLSICIITVAVVLITRYI